ncbi:MAG: hypothetical protein NE328_19885 [Lentisphaeraceae bacterium]|nr:hypothetical protein [Lentisphaeraceae bacterium]
MSQEVEWKNQQERGAFWAFRLSVFTYRILGRTVCSLIIYPVVFYFYLTGGNAKKASLKYLRKIYAHPQGKKHFKKTPGFRDGFKHSLSFAFSILDKFGVWLNRITYDDIHFPGREELIKRMEKKEGLVFLSAHYGNIEIMRAVSQTISEVPVNVIMDRKNAESFNKILKSTNNKFDISIFASDEIDISTAGKLKEKIANGEIVAVMADRLTDSSTSRYESREFLGETACFPQGPFIIPWLLKAPTYMFICTKKGKNYEVNFEKFFDVDDFQQIKRNVFVENICDRYVENLEKHCLKDPWQWYNFYDFWKKPANSQVEKTVKE